MKRKYRIGDVLYYDDYVFVITGFTIIFLDYMYSIHSSGVSMWISEQEIHNNGKLIKI